MTNSKPLARLIGPTIVVLTISEMINFHIWATNIPPVTYLNGIILFVAGLSIVLAHNYWVLRWQVLITLVGWFGIAGGLFRTFFPEAQQAGDTPASYVVVCCLLAIGIFLTYKAYKREDSPAPKH